MGKLNDAPVCHMTVVQTLQYEISKKENNTVRLSNSNKVEPSLNKLYLAPCISLCLLLITFGIRSSMPSRCGLSLYEEYRAFILDLFQRLQILIFNLSFPWNLLSENLRQFISDPSRERAICEFKNTCDSIYKSIFKWQALWKLYKWRYYIALQMRILYNIFHHKNDISWSIRRTG